MYGFWLTVKSNRRSSTESSVERLKNKLIDDGYDVNEKSKDDIVATKNLFWVDFGLLNREGYEIRSLAKGADKTKIEVRPLLTVILFWYLVSLISFPVFAYTNVINKNNLYYGITKGEVIFFITFVAALIGQHLKAFILMKWKFNKLHYS